MGEDVLLLPKLKKFLLNLDKKKVTCIIFIRIVFVECGSADIHCKLYISNRMFKTMVTGNGMFKLELIIPLPRHYGNKMFKAMATGNGMFKWELITPLPRHSMNAFNQVYKLL